MSLADAPTDLFIAGRWRAAAGNRRFEVIDPASGEPSAAVADASIADALDAVAAAAAAQPAWAATAPRQRAEVLRRAFELTKASTDPLAEIIVRENGKPLDEARGEVLYAAEFYRWFSEEAVRLTGTFGNAPFIVFADADLDAAVEGAIVAKMRHNAEACTAANRFYVEAAVAEAFTAKLTAAMGSLRVGPGMESGVQVGPLVDRAGLEKVSRLVEAAVAAGAEVRTGGAPGEGPGFFFPPTVLAGVSADSPILREEIFGPVAPIVAFRTEAEVIGLANAVEYGLVSYVYTADLARGLRVAEALESGMVGLNRGVVSDPAAPFGGVKQSGIGREGGREGVLAFTETKYVALAW